VDALTYRPPPSRAGRRRANGGLEAEIRAVPSEAGGPLSSGEVAERLGPAIARSTVMTTPLHAKRQLIRTRGGRANALETDVAGFTAPHMCGVLGERPDREAVLTQFAEGPSGADGGLLRRPLGSDPLPDR
jgi:hypothetical protein